MRRLLFIVLLLLAFALLPQTLAVVDNSTMNNVSSGFGTTNGLGMVFVANNDLANGLVNITLGVNSNATRIRVFNLSGGPVLIFEHNFTGYGALGGRSVELNMSLIRGNYYSIIAGSRGAAHAYTADNVRNFPQNATMVNFTNRTYIIGDADGTGGLTYDRAELEELQLFISNYTAAPAASAPVMTLTLNDLVTGSQLGGFCVNVTHNNASAGPVNICNVTGGNIPFNTTFTSGNITFYNITATNASAQWFNSTNFSISFQSTASLNGLTYQAILAIQSYRMFLNMSIPAFNATALTQLNVTTSGGTAYLRARNGTNNVYVAVAGNYSQNISCTTQALRVNFCNATGIYDNIFTIGATNATSGLSIGTFKVRRVNSTLGINEEIATTSHNVTFQGLQGYLYFFVMNATGFGIENATISASGATSLYNFSLGLTNTYSLTFLNETTNTRLVNDVFVQIISDAYAANYTVVNGSINISGVVPGFYVITYYNNINVPRNYYHNLTDGSFNQISLYVLDQDVSNFYTPTIVDEGTVPLANVTVSLLRQYVVGSVAVYRTVEMAKTDTNGQAVLRVVPNTISYKLLISDGFHFLLTAPTKFTSDTNTYTLNTEGNPVASLTGLPGVYRSLTYSNASRTFTFIWADSGSLVGGACFQVRRTKNGALSIPTDFCVSGASGTINYQVNDTNQTSYSAVGRIITDTEFSEAVVGPVTVDYNVDYLNFGLLGVLATLLVFLALAFLGGESGTAGAVVGGVVAILIMGFFGFIYQDWSAVVGVVIIGGILVFKLRGGE